MTPPLSNDPAVVQRILDHIDNRTTDLGEGTWREPVENYRSAERFAAAAAAKRGADLVTAGAAEDSAVARAIQQGLASGANEVFEFGRFEGAIGHFHRALHAALDGARARGRRQPSTE
jgi:hypothetical protein